MDAVRKWFCRHQWSFPRRWPEFRGRANADVQTCTKCGSRRLSTVQFGPEHQRILCATESGKEAHGSTACS